MVIEIIALNIAIYTKMSIINITVNAKKEIEINVLEWLESIFDPQLSTFGDHEMKYKHLTTKPYRL